MLLDVLDVHGYKFQEMLISQSLYNNSMSFFWGSHLFMTTWEPCTLPPQVTVEIQLEKLLMYFFFLFGCFFRCFLIIFVFFLLGGWTNWTLKSRLAWFNFKTQKKTQKLKSQKKHPLLLLLLCDTLTFRQAYPTFWHGCRSNNSNNRHQKYQIQNPKPRGKNPKFKKKQKTCYCCYATRSPFGKHTPPFGTAAALTTVTTVTKNTKSKIQNEEKKIQKRKKWKHVTVLLFCDTLTFRQTFPTFRHGCRSNNDNNSDQKYQIQNPKPKEKNPKSKKKNCTAH